MTILVWGLKRKLPYKVKGLLSNMIIYYHYNINILDFEAK
jgi:hypothetical protein